jgi:hypothetical protein
MEARYLGESQTQECYAPVQRPQGSLPKESCSIMTTKGTPKQEIGTIVSPAKTCASSLFTSGAAACRQGAIKFLFRETWKSPAQHDWESTGIVSVIIFDCPRLIEAIKTVVNVCSALLRDSSHGTCAVYRGRRRRSEITDFGEQA